MSKKLPDRIPLNARRPSLTIGWALLLIASMACSMFLYLDDLRESSAVDAIAAVTILGGPSFLGVPYLLWQKLRSAAHPSPRWGAGRLLWFSHGTAAWLLWPPVLHSRLSQSTAPRGAVIDPDSAKICYFYGTPLMGLYVLIALLAGGWIRRRRRSSRQNDWAERFGLILGACWAVLGFIVLWRIYVGGFR